MIDVRGVGKMYRIYDRPQDRLKQMLWLGRRAYGREFWAVRDVSFHLGPGETLGIIGRNGSGKSTLLQMVAGILSPTRGQVSTEGRIAALLELGSGFNPEFTGRENVFMNGTILGLDRATMQDRFEDIAAFASIGDFMDQPVKTYSSGMVVRLAFAVQVHVAAQVLIVDEALSVGDVFFQQKCFAHIRQLQRAGVTIVYVSHDTVSLQNLCDRAILMEKGELAFDGAPSEAVNLYVRRLGDAIGGPRRAAPAALAESVTFPAHDLMDDNILPARQGAPPAVLEISSARVSDAQGAATTTVEMMESLHFEVLLRARQAVAAPMLGLHLYDRLGNLVFAAATLHVGHSLPALDAGQDLVVRFRLEMRVGPGPYTFDLRCGEPGAGEDPNLAVVYDSRESLGPLSVVPTRNALRPFYGIAQLPLHVTHTGPR